MKRVVLSMFALLSLSIAGGLFAQTVSVLPCQEYKSKDGKIEPFTELYGSGSMDELFAAGFIATSARPEIISLKDFKAGRAKGLADARDALVDCTLEIWVSMQVYTDTAGEKRRTMNVPGKTEYRFTNVADGKVIASGSLPGIDISNDVETRVEAFSRNSGAAIAKKVIEALKQKGGDR